MAIHLHWRKPHRAWFTMLVTEGTSRPQVAKGGPAPSPLSSSSNKLRINSENRISVPTLCGPVLGKWQPNMAWAPDEYFVSVLSLLGLLKKSEWLGGFWQLTFIVLYFHGSLSLMRLHSYAFREFWNLWSLNQSTQTKLRNLHTHSNAKSTGCAPPFTLPVPAAPHWNTNRKPTGI